MRSNNHNFSIDLPGDLNDTQIESVLPTFIFINEKQNPQSPVSVAHQIQVLDWKKSKLENGEWFVDSRWIVRAS